MPNWVPLANGDWTASYLFENEFILLQCGLMQCLGLCSSWGHGPGHRFRAHQGGTCKNMFCVSRESFDCPNIRPWRLLLVLKTLLRCPNSFWSFVFLGRGDHPARRRRRQLLHHRQRRGRGLRQWRKGWNKKLITRRQVLSLPINGLSTHVTNPHSALYYGKIF